MAERVEVRVSSDLDELKQMVLRQVREKIAEAVKEALEVREKDEKLYYSVLYAVRKLYCAELTARFFESIRDLMHELVKTAVQSSVNTRYASIVVHRMGDWIQVKIVDGNAKPRIQIDFACAE